MSKEFRIFEVDKYDNRWFVARHSTMESAKFFLKRVKPEGEKFIIQDELGQEYAV